MRMVATRGNAPRGLSQVIYSHSSLFTRLCSQWFGWEGSDLQGRNLRLGLTGRAVINYGLHPNKSFLSHMVNHALPICYSVTISQPKPCPLLWERKLKLVGDEGFGPPTFCSQSRRSSQTELISELKNQQCVCGILHNLLDERGRCNENPVWVLTPHLRKTMRFSRGLHSPVRINFKSSSNCQRAMWLSFYCEPQKQFERSRFFLAGPLFFCLRILRLLLAVYGL